MAAARDDVGKAALLEPSERQLNTFEREQRARERYKYWTWLAICACCCCCTLLALGFLLSQFAAARGACCAEDGACEVTLEEECAATFLGFGVACDEATCPSLPPSPAPTPAPSIASLAPTPAPTPEQRGSCCLDRGGGRRSCVDGATATGCVGLGGTFTPDGVCSPETCPGTIGAGVCCSLDGGCSASLFFAECMSLGGAPSLGGECVELGDDRYACRAGATPPPSRAPTAAPTSSPTSPPPRFGSCCAQPGEGVDAIACFSGTTDGACAALAPDIFASTLFSDDAQACDEPSFCPGAVELEACCQFTSSCTSSLDFEQCTFEVGGAFFGSTTCNVTTAACELLPTPQPTPQPTITFPTRTPTQAPTPRPTVPQPPAQTGTCCVDAETQDCLADITIFECTMKQGSFLGELVNCSAPGVCGNSLAPTPAPTPFPPPQSGACCNPAGNICTPNLFESPCLLQGAGYTWGGANSTCATIGFCGVTAAPTPAPTSAAPTPAPPTPKPTPAPTALVEGSCCIQCDEMGGDKCFNSLSEANCVQARANSEAVTGTNCDGGAGWLAESECETSCPLATNAGVCCIAALPGAQGVACSDSATSNPAECVEYFASMGASDVLAQPGLVCTADGTCQLPP